MGNDDARSLDSQDTGGFAHPRGGQRAGGRKPLGCRAHFGCYRTDNVWLAGGLPARRVGGVEGQNGILPSAEVERARRRRQFFSAASASLKIMASAVLFERHPLERTVRWRTVANELSMGLVVRRCFQCSAGKS